MAQDLSAAKRNLEAAIRAKEAEIDDLRKKLSLLEEAEQIASDATSNGRAHATESKRFAGSGATDAIRDLILGSRKQVWTVDDILTDLNRGGFESESENVRNLVVATLHRLANNSELKKKKTREGRVFMKP